MGVTRNRKKKPDAKINTFRFDDDDDDVQKKKKLDKFQKYYDRFFSPHIINDYSDLFIS